MGYIDLILIIIIVVIGLRGFYNGFINEIAGMAGVVLGVFFASRFAEKMGGWLMSNIHNFNSPSISSLIGFVVILAIIWVAFLFIGIVISKFIKISDFALIDKILGFIFSCCKIFLIIGFILYGVSSLKFMESFNHYMTQNSRIYNLMEKFSSTIMKLQSVQDTANKINNMTDPATKAIKKEINQQVPNTKDIIDSVKNTAQDGLQKIQSDSNTDNKAN